MSLGCRRAEYCSIFLLPHFFGLKLVWSEHRKQAQPNDSKKTDPCGRVSAMHANVG
jgi:hypothetical protein